MKFHNSAQSFLDTQDYRCNSAQLTQLANIQAFCLYFYSYNTQLYGKMKTYSLTILITIYCICRYASVEMKPKLKKNILNFGYGINFKYEGC